MRHIMNLFSAIRSLGVLGIILIICVLIVAWSGFSVIRLEASLAEVYAQTQKRDMLEDVSFYLLEQQIFEQYLLYSEGEDQESLTEVSLAGDEITALVDELQIEWEGWLRPQETTLLNELLEGQTAYQQSLEVMIAPALAGDWDEVERLQQISETQMTRMNQQVEDLLFETETGLLGAIQDSGQATKQSILTGVVGLMALPFLAIWAFLIGGQITQPLLSLTNAITSIAGNQFRPELLVEVSDAPGRLGRLAQALEHLAKTVQDREQVLTQSINSLREQLYESKRRKRLPTPVRRELG